MGFPMTILSFLVREPLRIWAYGLRHPQHFSFDRSGKMYITEVGQKEVEEVNIGIKANYGWRIRKGTYASDTT